MGNEQRNQRARLKLQLSTTFQLCHNRSLAWCLIQTSVIITNKGSRRTNGTIRTSATKSRRRCWTISSRCTILCGSQLARSCSRAPILRPSKPSPSRVCQTVSYQIRPFFFVCMQLFHPIVSETTSNKQYMNACSSKFDRRLTHHSESKPPPPTTIFFQSTETRRSCFSWSARARIDRICPKTKSHTSRPHQKNSHQRHAERLAGFVTDTVSFVC